MLSRHGWVDLNRGVACYGGPDECLDFDERDHRRHRCFEVRVPRRALPRRVRRLGRPLAG